MNRTSSRLVSWSLALAAAALSLGGAGALTSGCGDTTGLRHVTFEARAGGFEHPEGAVQFTTRTGWTVTLREAFVAVGPVYLNELEPLACEGCQARTAFERLSDLLAPRAWAHGESHLGAGRVVGQVTRQVVVDALSPSLVTMPGGGDGLDLRARTAELWLFNHDGPTRGAALRVSGIATRELDGRTAEVPFSGALVADASITTPQSPLDVARRVRGIPVDFTLAEGGALTVRVDPRTWFDGADFAELEALPLDAQGTHPFTGSDNVGRAFVNAARAARGVYSLRFDASR
jgi:hypothetical protein